MPAPADPPSLAVKRDAPGPAPAVVVKRRWRAALEPRAGTAKKARRVGRRKIELQAFYSEYMQVTLFVLRLMQWHERRA